MPSRGKYRADGSMRPTVARRHKRRDRARRTAWLAQFERGARAEFFEKVKIEEALFASPMSRHLGLTKPETEKVLAQMAEERGWLKLATRDGRVVGIGPEKKIGRPEGRPDPSPR
jgi:hypothetical protein